MRWFLAAMLMLTFLTLMISSQNVVAMSRAEQAFSCQLAERCAKVMDHTSSNSVGIYLLAEANNNNGDENGETKEKELEADPAGGVDRIWNTVQLA